MLLAHLQALIGRAPDFSAYSATSSDYTMWLGQAHALLLRWNDLEASSFKMHCGFLGLSSARERTVGNIFQCLHRAIADLELVVSPAARHTFSAGEVYDFFAALKDLVASAEHDRGN